MPSQAQTTGRIEQAELTDLPQCDFCEMRAEYDAPLWTNCGPVVRVCATCAEQECICIDAGRELVLVAV